MIDLYIVNIFILFLVKHLTGIVNVAHTQGVLEGEKKNEARCKTFGIPN